MDEVSIIDILITIGSSYAIWFIIIMALGFKFGFFGVVLGATLPPLFAFFILPATAATTFTSLTYTMIFVILLLKGYLVTFGKKYPYNTKNIDIDEIKLSNENQVLFDEYGRYVGNMAIELEELEELDITKRDDGYYSERSKAGKEANSRRYELEEDIQTLEQKIYDLEEKQRRYKSKWMSTQTVRNNEKALKYALFMSFVGLLVMNLFYMPGLVTAIQEYILEHSQIKLLASFDNNYISLLEIGGTISLFLLPFFAYFFHTKFSPLGESNDDLEELFFNLNLGIYSKIEQNEIINNDK